MIIQTCLKALNIEMFAPYTIQLSWLVALCFDTVMDKYLDYLILSFPETMTSMNIILEFQVTSISYQ